MRKSSNLTATEQKLDQIAEAKKRKQATEFTALRDAEQKRIELSEALEAAEDAAEYQRIIQERKDNDDLIAFLKSKNSKFKPAITSEEYHDIVADAKKNIEQLQDDYAPQIIEKLIDLVELMDEYTAQARNAERVIDKASRLFNNCSGSRHYTGEISQRHNDPFMWFSHFTQMYFGHASDIARVNAGVNKGTKMFATASENVIAKAIRSQK